MISPFRGFLGWKSPVFIENGGEFVKGIFNALHNYSNSIVFFLGVNFCRLDLYRSRIPLGSGFLKFQFPVLFYGVSLLILGPV